MIPALAELLPAEISHPPTPLHNDNLMGAGHDGEALTLFLNKSGARSEETRRRYERETIRFTAFLYKELHIDYRSARLKHLQAYLHFIQNLPDHWLRPGILPGQPERVLFKESMKSGKSTDQVIDVLSSFFGFLDRNRYVMGNPAVSLIRSGEKTARGSVVIRFFYNDEWDFLKTCLTHMPRNTQKEINEAERSRYIIAIGYALALRESELTQHHCSDIHPDGHGGYYLSVLGKGRKRRTLPLNDTLLQQVEQYRLFHGLEGLFGNNFPLAPRTRKSAGQLTSLSSRGLRFWWQSFMNYCASEAKDDRMAKRFREMPFHSLRHTALTHLANRMDIEDLAIFAGHDSINTTSQYYHAEINRLKSKSAEHFM